MMGNDMDSAKGDSNETSQEVMDDPFIEDPSLEKMNNDDGDLAEPIDIFLRVTAMKLAMKLW